MQYCEICKKQLNWAAFVLFPAFDSFHEFFTNVSCNRYLYDFWSSWWSPDKSIAIWIYTKSGFSADLSPSEKSRIIMSLWVCYYCENSQFFTFFNSELSLRVFKSLASFESSCLFLRFCFVCRDTALIGSCHGYESFINDEDTILFWCIFSNTKRIYCISGQ